MARIAEDISLTSSEKSLSKLKINPRTMKTTVIRSQF